MKRLLTSAILFLCCAATSFAQFSGTVTDAQGVKYTANDDDATCYVSGHEQTHSATVTIPDTYEGRSVTSIGGFAFDGCFFMESVTIPNSVTSIGDDAFHGCPFLTSVTIGNSVTSIGGSAFRGCSGLTSVTIPNSVTSIGDYAFNHCSGLTSVTIPNSVTSIGREAFSSTALYNNAGNGIFYVDRWVCGYKGDKPTGNLVLAEDSRGIGQSAFNGCSGLTSVAISTSVTSVGDCAFQGCSGLTYIVVEEGNTKYDSRENCNAIIETNTNTLVVGCKTTLIPNSVTSIGGSAFYDCSGLTSVTIPNSVTSIGGSAFRGCSGLTYIIVEEGNTKYDSRENCNAIIETSTNTLIAGCKTTVIPNSVTSIGNYAFYNCSGLTSLTIPESVTNIGMGAFCYCRGLTSVTIPNSVTSIGDYAFHGCSGLTSVTIGNSVTSIGDFAFDNCIGLTSLTIPNSVMSIGEHAFFSCYGLTSVTIGNSVTSIGNGAFHNCTGLTSVTIPNSVTSIGNGAFQGCTGLISVTIPNSVTSIVYYAFYGCSSLISVTVESETPVSIGYSTFSNSTNATLYVPYGCKAAYEVADGWKDFKEIVEFVVETDVSDVDNVIYAKDLQAYVGAQKGLTFKMKNTRPIRGFQFDLTLPAGVTPATYANGTIKCSLANGRLAEGDQHTISVSQQNDGSYRVLCGSLQNDVFTGNDGEVLTLTVIVADDMVAGSYPIMLKNITLTETDISNYYETDKVVVSLAVDDYKQGDFSGDGKTDVLDYIGVANYILGDRSDNQNAKAADVDGNNKVDVSDYIGIANIILTGSVNGNQNAAARINRQENSDGLDPQ